MTTGKRLLGNVHSSSWVLYRYRGKNSERAWQSDRMKGVRKAVNKQLRSYLKREAKEQLEAELKYDNEIMR